MKNSTITDDELIQSLCIEENKAALLILYERHGGYLYCFVRSWLQASYFWGRVSHPGLRDSIAEIILIKTFNQLWDDRNELMRMMKHSKLRLQMSEGRSENYQTVREYLKNYAGRLVTQVPQSFEKIIMREQ